MAKLFNFKPGEGWMMVLTGVVAFTTVTQLIVSCNNKSTGTQVDRIITAANQIDLAADNFANSASGINRGVQDAVNKLTAQAAVAENARKFRCVIERPP